MPDAGVALEGTALPTWVGVGGSPQSVIRAARLACLTKERESGPVTSV